MGEKAKIPFAPQYGGFGDAAQSAPAAVSGSQLGNVLSSIGIDQNTLKEIAAAAAASQGYKGPKKYVQTTVPSITSVSKTLDTIAADLLGRQLSQEEKNKYYAMLQAEENKPSSATTTVTTPVGVAKDISKTTGGLNEEQFLIEKLAGTDEARAQKVLNAYTAVNKLFGGLQ